MGKVNPLTKRKRKREDEEMRMTECASNIVIDFKDRKVETGKLVAGVKENGFLRAGARVGLVATRLLSGWHGSIETRH